MTRRLLEALGGMDRGIVGRIQAWAEGHARALVWIGLIVAALAPLSQTSGMVSWSPEGARLELTRKEDIHNLYYAAASASWRDAPHWWVGSWIYPDVGYYRPLTSMLFLFEYRTFGANFTAYNRITQLLHHINVGLIYLLTVSLFRKHRRGRAPIGLVAAYYFASTDNSMFFAIPRVLGWWPAQNDVLSLTFGLLSLVSLDQYLHRNRVGWLVGAMAAFFLSIASKEMGFIVAPIALALIAQRRAQGIGPWRAATIATIGITAITAFMWFFRRMVIPNHWGPVMFRRQILERMLLAWFGPPALMAYAGIVWPAVATVLIAIVVAIGLKRRWPVVGIAALAAFTACLTIQVTMPDGTFAILLFEGDEARLWSGLIYLLAATLSVRYVRKEPALFTGCALWLVYLPILQYGGGKHYYYWPGAFNAVADAAFVACLWRWAGELRAGANWEWRLPFIRGRAERENAVVS